MVETSRQDRGERSRSSEPKVGAKIRTIRTVAGLSLRTLAERSGLSVNTISLIERGDRRLYSIVGDFNVVGIAVTPPKADPPLVTDANTLLPHA